MASISNIAPSWMNRPWFRFPIFTIQSIAMADGTSWSIRQRIKLNESKKRKTVFINTTLTPSLAGRILEENNVRRKLQGKMGMVSRTFSTIKCQYIPELNPLEVQFLFSYSCSHGPLGVHKSKLDTHKSQVNCALKPTFSHTMTEEITVELGILIHYFSITFHPK